MSIWIFDDLLENFGEINFHFQHNFLSHATLCRLHPSSILHIFHMERRERVHLLKISSSSKTWNLIKWNIYIHDDEFLLNLFTLMWEWIWIWKVETRNDQRQDRETRRNISAHKYRLNNDNNSPRHRRCFHSKLCSDAALLNHQRDLRFHHRVVHKSKKLFTIHK